MTLETTTPLQFQALVEHFAVECSQHDETGVIVSDWSNHSLDAHASVCVATFVISRRLPLRPSVYYANSRSSHAIQVADLVSGIRRRAQEGDTNGELHRWSSPSISSRTFAAISLRLGLRTSAGIVPERTARL